MEGAGIPVRDVHEVSGPDVVGDHREFVDDVRGLPVAAQCPADGAAEVLPGDPVRAEGFLSLSSVDEFQWARGTEAEAGVQQVATTIVVHDEDRMGTGVGDLVHTSQAAFHRIAQALESGRHQLGVLEAHAATGLVQQSGRDVGRGDSGMLLQEHVDVGEGQGAHVRALDPLEL